MKKKTFRKLEVLLHILTAAILLLKGFDEVVKRLYFPGCILLGLGLLVLIISLFWRKLGIKPKQARIMCYYIEAPALFLISYMLHLEKKGALPQFFLLAGMLYPMLGFISSKKFKKINKSIGNML
ncbi:hypothetical protein OGH69_15840 [Flavobacterium sp. MFBS3-15]|uniref:hypothetical protein n=1 Tax=Flavobacterium sp. MFBS3-15 TaxID=2989816 RepID=UPI0022359F63|nr:hypothetical protein [Flavobacterium sp. MFBS3-15]MCW4470443.1 hypothetical protein [Flavobacterium sp. MFBS3-15]